MREILAKLALEPGHGKKPQSPYTILTPGTAIPTNSQDKIMSPPSKAGTAPSFLDFRRDGVDVRRFLHPSFLIQDS